MVAIKSGALILNLINLKVAHLMRAVHSVFEGAPASGEDFYKLSSSRGNDSISLTANLGNFTIIQFCSESMHAEQGQQRGN